MMSKGIIRINRRKVLGKVYLGILFDKRQLRVGLREELLISVKNVETKIPTVITKRTKGFC